MEIRITQVCVIHKNASCPRVIMLYRFVSSHDFGKFWQLKFIFSFFLGICVFSCKSNLPHLFWITFLALDKYIDGKLFSRLVVVEINAFQPIIAILKRRH